MKGKAPADQASSGAIVHFGGNAPNEHLRDTVLYMC